MLLTHVPYKVDFYCRDNAHVFVNVKLKVLKGVLLINLFMFCNHDRIVLRRYVPSWVFLLCCAVL